ncbi:MAG: alpha/beta hydrolase [Candidatus Hydrogenedens sp.]|nr:alpha/beta hydrolase [Candidatus Hydrogenedens sp.]
MTTAPLLVYLHGWALDRRLWDGVRRRIGGGDEVTLDFGFFGAPALLPDLSAFDSGRPVIAIGHSLGVLWLLLNRPFRWSALVSVNGFDRFTEAADFRPAVPRRVVERMLTRFERDPGPVVDSFRRSCGLDQSLPGALQKERLRDGLRSLRDGDGRAAAAELATPILALSGGGDPILPEGMGDLCFRAGPAVTRAHHPDGGHLLPLTASDWCADAIRGFLSNHGANDQGKAWA